MLSHRLKAAAAEGDMVDDTGRRRLRLVGERDIVEMQHRMAVAVKPGPGKIERRARPVHETQDVLVEADRVAELSGRDIVVVEHSDAHAHAVLLRLASSRSESIIALFRADG